MMILKVDLTDLLGIMNILVKINMLNFGLQHAQRFPNRGNFPVLLVCVIFFFHVDGSEADVSLLVL